MPEIQFETSKKEHSLILRIVDRAIDECGFKADDKLDLDMDITATHCNGCPLDLSKLLSAPKFDFAHDVCGIRRHLDRTTGKLGGFFLPRCAKPDKPMNKRQRMQAEEAARRG